jgi:Cu+-exporting ATPase
MADAAAYREAAEAVEASVGTKVVFAIKGMTCGDCSDKLTKAVMSVAGVEKAAFDYQTGEAKIAFSNQTDAKTLLAVIKKAGYKAEMAPPA